MSTLLLGLRCVACAALLAFDHGGRGSCAARKDMPARPQTPIPDIPQDAVKRWTGLFFFCPLPGRVVTFPLCSTTIFILFVVLIGLLTVQYGYYDSGWPKQRGWIVG